MEENKVFLIGAGPGDSGLLTLRAKALIESADCVLYDSLVGADILSWIPVEARNFYVGKRAGKHSLKQEEINQLIIQEAQKGGRIVRLKGGDPFVFGRGGEEVLALIDAGIDFEVVPGVTSAIAAATYSGIPITHREIARSFHVFTGSFKSGAVNDHFDFDAISRLQGTLVFLMSVGSLGKIVAGLIAAGKDKTTPVAIIENGTLPYQRHCIGNLETIEAVASAEKISTPAIVVIGEVVNFSEQFYREKDRPLLGKKVIVTRSRVQASVLRNKLEDLGARALECPAIQAYPSELTASDLEKLNHLASYNWLIFTSANSVKSFFKILINHKIDYRVLANIKISVVGTVTQEVLASYGFIADLIPKSYHSVELYKALMARLEKGDKIIRVRGGFADQTLVDKLIASGYQCDELTVYEISAGEFSEKADDIESADVITFTSGSTVRYFSDFIQQYQLPDIKDKRCICIGPLTAKWATEAGYTNIITANPHTIDAVVEEVIESVKRDA